MFCSGHVLLEDIPAPARTTMAKALAISGERVQANSVHPRPAALRPERRQLLQPEAGRVRFSRRAPSSPILCWPMKSTGPPRTQSSLLECMEEGQVTIDGVTTALEKPSFSSLPPKTPSRPRAPFPPEAQLDRFARPAVHGYPEGDQERAILNRFRENTPWPSWRRRLQGGGHRGPAGHPDGAGLRRRGRYMVDLANATRQDRDGPAGCEPPRNPDAHAGLPGPRRHRGAGLCDSRRCEGGCRRRFWPTELSSRATPPAPPLPMKNYIRQLLATVPAPHRRCRGWTALPRRLRSNKRPFGRTASCRIPKAEEGGRPLELVVLLTAFVLIIVLQSWIYKIRLLQHHLQLCSEQDGGL